MRIGVVGCGHVGFAYLQWLAGQGHEVVGVDPLTSVRKAIHDTLGSDAVASDDIGALAGCSSVHICVPTDPFASGEADLRIFDAVIDDLVDLDASGAEIRVISQRSTCPPGTGDSAAARFSERVAYGVNPSFLRKAAIAVDTAAPERLAFGGPAAYRQHLELLHEAISAPRFVTESRSVIELLKYVENALDALLLSFWNELLLFANAQGVAAADFCYLLDGIGDRAKFSSCARVPGRAFGLWCLPKDLDALIAAFDAAGLQGTTLRAAREVNNSIRQTLGDGTESSIALFEDGATISLTDRGRSQVYEALGGPVAPEFKS
jgi:UDPglucose 6-dehydrogenase